MGSSVVRCKKREHKQTEKGTVWHMFVDSMCSNLADTISKPNL